VEGSSSYGVESSRQLAVADLAGRETRGFRDTPTQVTMGADEVVRIVQLDD